MNIYLPLTFPENVPLVFVMDCRVPLYEAHLLQDLLHHGGDALLDLVNQLVLVLRVLVPLELGRTAVTRIRRNGVIIRRSTIAGVWRRRVKVFSSFVVIVVRRMDSVLIVV